jgi:regulation of enolase protein 1 (concanavalin A-like superfamily)
VVQRERLAPPRRSRTTGGAGLAGLVLGIIALMLGVPALLVSWVPVVCVFSLLAGGLGLVIGLVGIVAAAIQKGPGLGLSIGGGVVNLLALLVALTMTLFTGGMLVALGETAEHASTDGPSDGATVPGWGQMLDPDGDCTIGQRGEALTIDIPATPHDLSAELGRVNSPRVLQEVQGDFTIQVKVCGTIRPTAPATIPSRVPFQSGGLLMLVDRNNYVRMERAAFSRDGVLRSYASLEARTGGQRPTAVSAGLLDQDAYLRLQRRGNQLRGSYSIDGRQWTSLAPMNVAYPDRVAIGVTAVNAAQQPLAVRFEELLVEK